MTVKATLGGVALLGDGAVTWRQTHGVFPVVQEFTMEPSRAENLVSGPGIPIDLVVSDDGRTHVWADLLVVGHSPATNPYMTRVKVVDKRWYWKFKIVVMRFNMRRRIGTIRRETLDTDKQQPNVVPRLQYAPYSLKPGTVAAKANKKGQGGKGAKKAKPLPSRVWTAPEVIQTIIERASPVGTRIILDPSLDTLKALPIENLVIDDEGPAAVQRALSRLPGARVTVDPNGDIRVYSGVAGGESISVGTGSPGAPGGAGPEIVGGGHIQLIDNHRRRPRKVRVYFTYECELRFDFIADMEIGKEEGSVADKNSEPKLKRELENVCAIPDFQLQLADRIEYQGTFLTFTEILNAYNNGANGQTPKGSSIFAGKLTNTLINEMMVWDEIWRAVNVAGAIDLSPKVDGKGEVDPDSKLLQQINWATRLQAIRENWRTLWRIPQVWLDRILHLRPYLIGTIDQASGQRAPAMAFGDYCVRHSHRGAYLDAGVGRGRANTAWAWNVSGYPGQFKAPTKAMRPSPCRIVIVDEDQGVFRTQYYTDPYHIYDHVYPSKIDNIAKRNLRKNGRVSPICWNQQSKNGKLRKLSDDQKIAVYLTAIPAAPNDKTQLFYVDIEASDPALKAMLPTSLHAGLTEARGPMKEVRIPPGVETARVRWIDQGDYPKAIEAIFGVSNDAQAGVGAQESFDGLLKKALVTNYPEDPNLAMGLQGPGAAAGSLKKIALAVAAGVYAAEADKIEGGMTGRMRAALLSGNTGPITHTVGPDGSCMTMYSLPPELDKLDMFSFMDSGTRSIVLRLAKVQ